MMYMHHESWRANLERIRMCRQQIKSVYGIPIKMEFHTKNFLLDKNPYRVFGLSSDRKKAIVAMLLNLVNRMDVRIVNVVIDKTTIRSSAYDVFGNALTYGLQRIHNDLKRNQAGAKFMVIPDEGRRNKTVYTARRMRAFNHVPSRSGGSYRDDVHTMIEDPLPKASSESWFIQLADLIVTVVYYYKLLERGVGVLPGRMTAVLNEDSFGKMLEMIKPRLNLQATNACKCGIVNYPK